MFKQKWVSTLTSNCCRWKCTTFCTMQVICCFIMSLVYNEMLLRHWLLHFSLSVRYVIPFCLIRVINYDDNKCCCAKKTNCSIQNSRVSCDLSLCRCCFFNVLSFTGTGCVVPFMPVFARQLGFSTFVVGTIYSILPILGLISKPLFGALADRYAFDSTVYCPRTNINFIKISITFSAINVTNQCSYFLSF